MAPGTAAAGGGAPMDHEPDLRLSLELLTPAFAGGAEPSVCDSTWPLRPSAVRGALRAWLRFLAAPWPDRDWAREVQGLEERLFGHTGQASLVVIEPPEVKEKGQPLDPRALIRPDRRGAGDRGYRYLGYGKFENPARPAEALFMQPGQRIELAFRLKYRRGDPASDEQRAAEREVLRAAIWSWAHLGGLGSRSRRGFGSLFAAHLGDHWPAWVVRRPPQSGASAREEVETQTKKAAEIVKGYLSEHRKVAVSPAPTARREVRTFAGMQIDVLPMEFDSGEEALTQVGELFLRFRSSIERPKMGMVKLPDYQEVKEFIRLGTAPQRLDRAELGLPLNFYYRSLAGGPQKASFLPDGGERIPSPLHFRVQRLANGRVVVLLLDLRGPDALLGRGLVGKVPGSGKRELGPGAKLVPNRPSLIRLFIAWATAQLGGGRSGAGRAGGGGGR